MRILGIDYGEARTGFAITDELGITAQGLETLQSNGSDKLILHLGGSTRIANNVYDYKSYFMFYRKVNGAWQYQTTVAAPGNGTKNISGGFITLNDNTILYNSQNNGLYVIQY